MEITDAILPIGEYYADVRKKETIYIHHTAGGHRPDWTIHGWKQDRTRTGNRLAVGTAYVIGGMSTSTNELEYDGKIYRAFDENYWAHHLGIRQQNNRALNQKSIGIEICNYGPLTKTSDGKFLNYVNREVPMCMVQELERPFRGFKYYHRYTEKQMESLKWLLGEISTRHGIDLNKGLREMLKVDVPENVAFDLNSAPLKGHTGLWTHTNVRRDKTDCSPQPHLVGLINSLS